MNAVRLVMTCFLGTSAVFAADLVADAPNNCDSCAEWNRPQEPFPLSDETWYVGTKGLSAILITSPQGHILIDGGLPQSAPLIAASIEKAGFHLKDVKLILNSHTHFDHAAGIAAHFTPGHTPGGTTWTWKGCDRDDCVQIVYADSLNSISAPGFRFSDDPGRVAEFRKSIETVAGLECGILLAPHPELFDRDAKLAARTSARPFDAFRNRGECRTYAERARQRFEKRLAEERR